MARLREYPARVKSTVVMLNVMQQPAPPFGVEREKSMSDYRAEFLQPPDKDSIEWAGYEFANGGTEEYRKVWWDILLERVRTEGVKETCICAAIKTTCNQVIRGHRHHDCISIAMANMLDPIGLEGQGFVTSTGRYVDRLEGYQLQVAADIESVARGGYRGVRLFSEDLY